MDVRLKGEWLRDLLKDHDLWIFRQSSLMWHRAYHIKLDLSHWLKKIRRCRPGSLFYIKERHSVQGYIQSANQENEQDRYVPFLVVVNRFVRVLFKLTKRSLSFILYIIFIIKNLLRYLFSIARSVSYRASYP